MRKEYELGLFDVSGTLVDDFESMYRADQWVFSEFGLTIPDRMQYGSVKRQYDKWEGFYLHFGLKKEFLRAAGDLFLAKYFEALDRIRPFDESEQVILELKRRNMKVGIVTLLNRKAVKQISHMYSWMGAVDTIVAFDDVMEGEHN